MRLISSRYPTSRELKHAYSTDEATRLVKQHLNSGQDIEGMGQLRSFLMLDFDSEVIKRVENGEWLLIKDEAYYFDWGQFDKSVRQQLFSRRMKELISPTPAPEKKWGHVFRVINSETGRPVPWRTFIAIVDGKRSLHATDTQGIGRVSAPLPGSTISIHVIFSAPTGELGDFLEVAS